jgi:NADH-quinone oxidoreductase subunit C
MQLPKALDPVESVKSAFPDAVEDVKTYRDETTLVLKPESMVAVATYLRDTPGLIYNFLADVSAVDYYPDYYSRPGRFGVSYHLLSMLYARRLRLKVYLQEDDPSTPSLHSVWPCAAWQEREQLDLMGITFTGHPDPRRVLLPDDWDGHPLRRDYPLGYETVLFWL